MIKLAYTEDQSCCTTRNSHLLKVHFFFFFFSSPICSRMGVFLHYWRQTFLETLFSSSLSLFFTLSRSLSLPNVLLKDAWRTKGGKGGESRERVIYGKVRTFIDSFPLPPLSVGCVSPTLLLFLRSRNRLHKH